MIRIVWISSCIFSNDEKRTTGTWHKPMALGLLRSGQVELYNITRDHTERAERQGRACGVEQWVLPAYRWGQGLLLDHESDASCRRIRQIIDGIKPDVVHIWGTEFKWASVYERGYISYPTLIDMQGIYNSIIEVYFGGLKGWDLVRSCIGWHEVLHPRQSLLWTYLTYRHRAMGEKRTLNAIPFVSTQSDFTRSWVGRLAPKAQILSTGIILRQPFYDSKAWQPHAQRPAPVIFASASRFGIPYKGMHHLLHALTLLRRQYPEIQLHIVGKDPSRMKSIDAYMRFMLRYIEREGLSGNIKFLGPLTADEIIDALHESDFCVVTSLFESYCLALVEAMMVGIPCVAARAGSIPEVGTDGQELLLYEPYNPADLAQRIVQLWTDRTLQVKLGKAARARRMQINAPAAIIAQQIENYKTVIAYSAHTK